MPKEYTLIGGNGTRVSPLEVNESGTYEAGDSRAFNPVKVNVPSGSSTLSGLTDVDISNPADGQTLVYNANSGKWENGAGGGGAAYFVDCSYALDEHDNPKLTSSKTTAEIRAAMESGALVYIRFVEPGDTSEGVPDMTHVCSLSGMSVGTAEGVTVASFGVAILYSGHSDEMYTNYTAMADYPVFVSPR